jgi:hypothetical protein
VNFDHVASLAQTLLYEGYLLYPYRTSAVKNQHRWLFGTLYPRSFVEGEDEGDYWWIRTECLVEGTGESVLQARARFLHLHEDEVVEREIDAGPCRLARLGSDAETVVFGFGDGVRSVHGTLALSATRAGDELYAVTATIRNLSSYDGAPPQDRHDRRQQALRRAFASTHTLLGVSGGQFVSLTDPPSMFRAQARACRNVGTWPILVGDPDRRDTMLSAPIILEDFPNVAPESAGDFFDATELDELLTLRVMTLTDAEKTAMSAGDARARNVLERTEAQTEDALRRLHGAARAAAVSAPRPRTLEPGTRVRLRPQPGADIFDLALAGKTATVVKTEQDYEGRVLLAVTVDDDPGRDLGIDGRPGHRFFFRPDEVELLQ